MNHWSGTCIPVGRAYHSALRGEHSDAMIIGQSTKAAVRKMEITGLIAYQAL
jgi:hypothetical protein